MKISKIFGRKEAQKAQNSPFFLASFAHFCGNSLSIFNGLFARISSTSIR
jgi:hypothetical protein